MSGLFQYPDLPPKQKIQLEQKILGKLFQQSLPELQYLLTTSFPFTYLDRLWLERYCELAQFQKEKGHLQVETRYLRRWMTYQRILQRKGKLSAKKQRALNRLKGFSWAPEQDKWLKQYETYRNYLCGPSRSAGKSQISWVSDQRQRWNALSERQRKLLLGLGVTPDPYGKRRLINLRKMEVYFQKHGHLAGLSRRLVKFSLSMRRMQRQGKLDPQIKARLDRIHFKWFVLRRSKSNLNGTRSGGKHSIRRSVRNYSG